MRFSRLFLMACLTVLLAGAGTAQAESTEITVRVLAKDAKFVGTSMGGVRITLSDAETGEVLARGLTQGGTGDTSLVMHNDGGRRAPLADESAAAFTTKLELDAPRRIKAEAYGPLAQTQAAQHVSATQWVVPGRHLTAGDGWVLEMPGFVVDVLAPPAHATMPPEKAVELHANVTMMCGCPIAPEGLWDANGYEVTAWLRRDGEVIGEYALEYAGKTSQFRGQVPINAPGLYDVTVFAYDPETGNTGLDRTTFSVPDE